MSRATLFFLALALSAPAARADITGEMDARRRLLEQFRRTTTTPPVPAPSDVRAAHRSAIQTPEGARRGRRWIARYMIDEWTRLGLGPDQQAALLAIGWTESRLNLAAISADGLPDDRVGKSWGAFQFSRPTLKTLDLTLRQLAPQPGPDGRVSDAELERASRSSARAAVRFLMIECDRCNGEPWLHDAVRRHRGDAGAIARDMMVIWSSGHRWRYDDIVARARRHPEELTRIGTLGYVKTQVAERMHLFRTFFRPEVRRHHDALRSS